jgi:hypothetical protein
VADERAERIARNEVRFRDINERVERDLVGVVAAPGELLPFVCECGRRDCTRTLELTIREYEHVRDDPTWFAVVPGHEIEDVESVIERQERFAVIRKNPPTHDIVKGSDPRR